MPRARNSLLFCSLPVLELAYLLHKKQYHDGAGRCWRYPGPESHAGIESKRCHHAHSNKFVPNTLLFHSVDQLDTKKILKIIEVKEVFFYESHCSMNLLPR